MKSKGRKTGGAYRRMKKAISLHTKKGKDRSKQKGKVKPNGKQNQRDCQK